MKRVLIIVAVLAVVGVAAYYFLGPTLALPGGWQKFERKPEEYCPGMKSPTDGMSIQSDFDDDTKPDEALILQNTMENKIAIFAFLSSLQAFVKVRDIEGNLGTTMLALSPSGEFPTACGKGAWDCIDGEPEKLNLKSPAINVIFCESSDVIYVWDSSKKAFSEVWMSD